MSPYDPTGAGNRPPVYGGANPPVARSRAGFGRRPPPPPGGPKPPGLPYVPQRRPPRIPSSAYGQAGTPAPPQGPQPAPQGSTVGAAWQSGQVPQPPPSPSGDLANQQGQAGAPAPGGMQQQSAGATGQAPDPKQGIWEQYVREGKPGDWQAYLAAHQGGGTPTAPTPTQGQQSRFEALQGIDPMVLWGRRYQQENPGQFGAMGAGDVEYGKGQADQLMSLLPPRILNEVNAGRMNLNTALARYLDFLKGRGATLPSG